MFLMFAPLSIFPRYLVLLCQNAYGENLGITEEGQEYVPLVVQNLTCVREKMTVHIWKGICTDGVTGSCNPFDDSNHW